jgi:hypothetical protein
MGKIVSALYSDTGPTVREGSGTHEAIELGDGNMICVRVPLSSEGYVKQLVVAQKTGTATAYTVELLASKIPYPVGEYANSTSPVGTIQLYRIIRQQTLGAGEVLDLTPDTEVGYPFRNLDGTYTMNERYVYLVIKPTSNSDDSTWDALVVVDVPVY